MVPVPSSHVGLGRAQPVLQPKGPFGRDPLGIPRIDRIVSDQLLDGPQPDDGQRCAFVDGVSDDAELATRRQGWTPNPPRYTTGVLGKYAKLVQGAETGAITNVL